MGEALDKEPVDLYRSLDTLRGDICELCNMAFSRAISAAEYVLEEVYEDTYYESTVVKIGEDLTATVTQYNKGDAGYARRWDLSKHEVCTQLAPVMAGMLEDFVAKAKRVLDVAMHSQPSPLNAIEILGILQLTYDKGSHLLSPLKKREGDAAGSPSFDVEGFQDYLSFLGERVVLRLEELAAQVKAQGLTLQRSGGPEALSAKAGRHGQPGGTTPVSDGDRSVAGADELDVAAASKHPVERVVDDKTAMEASERIAAALEDWADPKNEGRLRYDYVGCEAPIRIALAGFDEFLNWLRSTRPKVAERIQAWHDDLIKKARLDDHLLETSFDTDVVHSEAAALDLAEGLRMIWTINEVPWAEPERTGAQATGGRTIPPTDTENNILEALGEEHMTGPVLLKKAGYDYSSHYRGILSNLVKRGILGNDETGYFRRGT